MPTESITLYFRQGNSDKVYKAAIFENDGGYVVNFAYGRRGSTLQTGMKTNSPVPFDQAKKIYDTLVRQKKAKGYSPGANGTAYASTPNEQRFTGILPQLLNPVDEAQVEKLITDRRFWMQEKKDGRRCIIQCGDTITGINRKGLTIGLPESIVKSATEIGLPFILDGEAIGDKFYAFDLLELNETNYRPCPYNERYEMLHGLLKNSTGSIELVPAHRSPSEKRAAFGTLKQANAEGVVFKNTLAYYMPGRPASGGPQLKFKFIATGTFIIAGVNAGKRSVGLELFNETGKTQYMGNVTVPANRTIPSVGTLVEVRYLYCFREGCLFQPVLLEERQDLSLDACTTAQLKYKPEENDDSE